MYIEDVYRLNMSTYRSIDNSYEFNYNHQWSTTTRPRSISVREVRLITSPRFLFIEGMYLGDTEANTCNIDCPIIVPSGTTLTSTDFRTNVVDLFTSFVGVESPWDRLDQFHIGYNPCTTTLSYSTTDERCLIIGTSSGAGFTISDDLKAITGLTDNQLWVDLSKVTHGDVAMSAPVFRSKYMSQPIDIKTSAYGVVAIRFTSVWNRDPLLIKSSFVDLAYDGYLGFTNSVFNPPKRFNIKSLSNRFNVNLYDGVSTKPIVLPSDQKDQVIIEAIMSTS